MAEIPQWAVDEFLIVFGIVVGAVTVGYIARYIVESQRHSAFHHEKLAELEFDAQMKIKWMRGIELERPWSRELSKEIHEGKHPVVKAPPGLSDEVIEQAKKILAESEVKEKEKAEA